MIRLHGSNDTELAILCELRRSDDLVVLDAKPEVARLMVLAGGSFRRREGVERHLRRAIADGVKAYLESSCGTLYRHAI